MFVGIISFQISVNTMTQRIFETHRSYMRSIRQSIDTLVNQMLNDYYYLLIDQRIRDLVSDILKMYPLTLSRASQEELEKEIRDHLLMFGNDTIGISFISDRYRLLFGDDISFPFSKIKDSSLYPQIVKNPNRFFLIKYGFGDDPAFDSMVSNGIYFAGLAHAGSDQWIVLIKTRPESVLLNDRAMDLMIVDEDGKIIWKNAGSIGDSTIKEVLKASKLQGSGSIKLPQTAPSRSVYYDASKGKGWIYLCIFNDASIEASKHKIFFFMLIVGLLLLAVFIVFSWGISKRIVSPLASLIENIKNVRHFTDHGKIKHHDALITKRIGTTSFRGKLILFYFVIIILPACLLIVLSYSYSHGFIIKQVEKSLLQTLKQTAKNIEAPLNEIERSSAFLAVNKSFQKAISSEERADAVNDLDKIILSQKNAAGGISSIEVYDRDAKLLYSTRPKSVYGEPYHQIDSHLLNEINGKKWSTVKKDIFDSFYIPFIRLVRSMDVTSKIGYLVTNVQERYIYEKAQNLASSPKIQTIVVDNEGTIVSAADVEMIASRISNVIPERRDPDPGATVSYRGTRYFYYSVPVHNSLWKLIFLIQKGEMTSDVQKILIANALTLLFMLILMLFTISVFSKRVVKPLTLIKNSLGGMQLSDLSVDWTISSNDELGELADAFRKMLKRLNTLLHEVYIHRLMEKELENRKKEAQLVALQYQINPHFLYNAFSSIKFLMKMGQTAKATRMITMMGRLFQNVVHNEQITCLRDEIDYVKAYVSIQRIRYRDKLRVGWCVDKNLYYYKMLKFTLQPIVENSIHHGMDGNTPLEILIRGQKNHETLSIEIVDNGPGIKPDEIAAIQENIMSDAPASSIGLKNINDRIHLYFGYDYGITIESKYGEGTRVQVTIPAIKQQDDRGAARVQLSDRG
jgi:two-component system sensor histidine kinase YesM